MRIIVIFVLAMLASLANSESLKVGYINVNEVIINLSQYRIESELLASEFEPRKNELLDLFEHIELLKENLINKANNLSNEDFQKEQEKIIELEIDFQKDSELWQFQLNQKKQILLNFVESLINQAIEILAKDGEYDLILYENVAFASDKIDLTEDIVNIIEASTP
tara:strand:- start:933 stop:1430 length:498 start_codon:yes stop_codon:yes gene_type:complete